MYGSVKARILDLRDTPRPPGCKKLRDRDGWRIRNGDYRVVYRINDSEEMITVLQIGHRREVYR